MNLITLSNPVFQVYAIAACLMVLKIMLQGWMTVFRMMKSDAGLVNPEDLTPGPLNKSPRAVQLELNDYVERSRRMHRNDLENIPAFLAVGLIFVTVDPALWLARVLLYGFVLARLAHSLAYATKQVHEVRASFYTIGSISVIYMALHVLWVVLA